MEGCNVGVNVGVLVSVGVGKGVKVLVGVRVKVGVWVQVGGRGEVVAVFVEGITRVIRVKGLAVG